MAIASNHHKVPDSFLNYAAKGPSPRILFLAAFVFSTYCVYSAYLIVATTYTCVERDLKEARLLGNLDSLRPFENDVMLEYQSFKGLCNKTNWKDKDCRNGSCTRVFMNGKKFIKPDSTSSITLTKTMHGSRRKPFSRLPHHNFTQIRYDLLSCEDIDKLWNDQEYKALKEYPETRESLSDKIVVKRGVLSKFFHPQRHRILSKEAFHNTSGYYKLKNQFKKRSYLGWNMEGLPRLFGACVTSISVRFVLEDVTGSTICDQQDPKEVNFTLSSCHQLVKFRHFVKAHEDVNIASLKFTKNFMCLIGLLEKKNMLIEDFYGSQFTVTTKEMKIIVNDLDNLLYYGKRNMYGNSICIRDIYCPSPRGSNWRNNSANTAIYNACHDIVPTCSKNRCVGFNASLHLCGMANWLKPIIGTLERVKEKRRLSNILNTLSTPYAEMRKTGEMACNEVSDMLQKYEYDKENGFASSRKKSFHVGRRPSNPVPNI